ncbi:hypothetical protein [Streptomyces longwoodensis]|uniref:hypothetical protein n=1 Tax=Streptomyces longwoodensis TaxID=68231 RepID=UPI003AF3B316
MDATFQGAKVGIFLKNARAAARKAAEIEQRRAEGLPVESWAGALSDERREQLEEIDASWWLNRPATPRTASPSMRRPGGGRLLRWTTSSAWQVPHTDRQCDGRRGRRLPRRGADFTRGRPVVARHISGASSSHC